MAEQTTNVLSELDYDLKPVEKGYANRTLFINLSGDQAEIKIQPVTEQMKELFTGGKGFDLWLMWDLIPKGRAVDWDDRENVFTVASGPLGGTTNYPGSGKSIIASISPLTHSVMDSNVGGYFGPYLKFAGFDALAIQGKAQEDVIIFIDGDNGKIIIEPESELTDESYILADKLTERFGGDSKRSVTVLSSGVGGKNSYFGILNSSWYDKPRKRVRYKQAGRGGLGTVFRDKKIKAVVVKYSSVGLSSNNPADMDNLKVVARKHSSEIRELDPKQNEMSKIGTTHLVTIMNDHDLLPVNNFQFGSHDKAPEIGIEAYRKRFDPGFDGCWVGCSVACSHGVKDFELTSGPYKGQKVFVDGPEYETIAGVGSNCGIFDPDHIIEINFYCDSYGIDTISLGTGTAFVMECYTRGIINDEVTGGLKLNFGNKEAALEILHQLARGEGFGAILGKGIRYMKKYFHEKYGADPKLLQDIGMEAKGLEYSEYMTKESLAQQGGYGLALKGPQHDEAWLIFLDMVHNFLPTFEDKAEALHWFPMWRTWFGLNGLCKLPWNDIVPEDNKETPEPAKVMKHVQWYSEYFSYVTGRTVKPEDLNFMSERVYNLERLFAVRLGFGTRVHDKIPYRSVGPVTVEEYESRTERYDDQLTKLGFDIGGKDAQEKLDILRKHREEQYEKLTDAVYKRRGWTADGVPTEETLKRLGLDIPEITGVVKLD
jgi:aldehyde:ferredoxin oxidoreductase